MNDLTKLTDEQLAMLYIDGNNRAFDLLLSRNQSRLFSYIIFVVKDRDVAEDIFQETFVKVITRLQQGRYVPSGKFAAWLMKISHNVIMDWYREQRSEKVVDASDNGDLSRFAGDEELDTFIEQDFVNNHGDKGLVQHPADGNAPCRSARGGVHALLSAVVVQRDCRVHRCEHQHCPGTHALCYSQHAKNGEDSRRCVATGVVGAKRH